MSSSKIAITLETSILAEVDALVKNHMFPNRSHAIQFVTSDKQLNKVTYLGANKAVG